MIALRPPETVMRLSRLGRSHQTRLSFMRVLLRGLRRDGWRVDRPVWEVDSTGVGRAVYRAQGPGQCYCLVAFAHDLPAEQRSDRVIAEAWDATFTLVDGMPSAADLDRLQANVPLQEAGRISDKELILSRANRSVRLWEHVVGRLATGAQPDPEELARVGYLMRTTAVYGSGKFGAADHAALADRGMFAGPFRAEMLTVWLIRAFVADLVEHMARARGGAQAVELSRENRRALGIGNSTGLGMAPFLVAHPLLLNAWISARETALARVRALPDVTPEARQRFADVTARSALLLERWHPSQPDQVAELARLRADHTRLSAHLADGGLGHAVPWDHLWRWGEANLSEDGQEWLLSLMLEPYGALVDDLATEMSADECEPRRIDGLQTVAQLRAGLQQSHGWALEPDYADAGASARFWYVSEAKQEPRLGLRHCEPGEDLEQPLDVGRMVAALAASLDGWSGAASVAEFLRAAPEHRRAVRRVQMAQVAPYADVRDNLIDESLRPIDMLRCKLACFGATRFDPRSDRWVRITMFQNAPYPDELLTLPEDDWVLPALPGGVQ